MPFIPHTAEDIHDMLKVLGVSCVNDLRDEIPHFRKEEIADAYIGLNEMEITRLMQSRADSDGHYLSFLGGGAYEHYVPDAVKQIQKLAVNFPRDRSFQAQVSPSMSQDYPELGPSMLVCATETKSLEDFELYARHLERILSKRRDAPPCAYKS